MSAARVSSCCGVYSRAGASFSLPKSFLSISRIAAQGSATSIMIFRMSSLMSRAIFVPMAAPSSAPIPETMAGRSRTLPPRKYLNEASAVPVPLTTLFVPIARCAGMPAIR